MSSLKMRFLVVLLGILSFGCELARATNGSSEDPEVPCSPGGPSPRLTLKNLNLIPSTEYRVFLNNEVLYNSCLEQPIWGPRVEFSVDQTTVDFYKEQDMKTSDLVSIELVDCVAPDTSLGIFFFHQIKSDELVEYRDGCGSLLGLGASLSIEANN